MVFYLVFLYLDNPAFRVLTGPRDGCARLGKLHKSLHENYSLSLYKGTSPARDLAQEHREELHR